MKRILLALIFGLFTLIEGCATYPGYGSYSFSAGYGYPSYYGYYPYRYRPYGYYRYRGPAFGYYGGYPHAWRGRGWGLRFGYGGGRRGWRR